ncbi:S-layer homology domain-containing protein [Iningainema tapete]|uniref:S-layer homology domain-containing protein n=1 Tax=Iningainema tapete BLCC-T55 TaxID=2748662 RepID=A0A8J7CHG7_9CYAN|nr:S-layer homology domain-containing protein [Iningainema tapete]MBD2777630.1 S-layer homology domain-containing protein [Iningainema tapete BLCC-T55]
MRQLLGGLFLVILLQYPVTVYAQVQPSDAIAQVVAAKLMNNYPDGNFYPERFISRAELASMMVKAFRLDKRLAVKKENLVVPDVPSSHWAYNDIQTVLKTDIMRGYRGKLFFPNQRVTKAEALAIFAQAYGVFQFPDETVNEILAPYQDAASIPTWARKAIATVASEGFIKPDTQGNISPLQPMTRGDMAYVLSKYLQRQQQQPQTPEAPAAPINPENR